MRTGSLLLALVLFGASPAAQLSPANSPNMPFIGALIRLRGPIVVLIRALHRNVRERRLSPGVAEMFDNDYDELSADVNGLIASVSNDIQRNDLQPADWQAQAGKIIQQAGDFRTNLDDLLHSRGRRQAGLYRGLGGTFNVEFSPQEKKLELTYKVDLDAARHQASQDRIAEFTAQLKAMQESAKESAAAAKQQRDDLLAALSEAKWPARCAVGLDKPACPASQKT